MFSPSMSFVLATLGKFFQQQVEVKPLFDFIASLSNPSETLTRTFLEKWTQCSNKALQRMVVISVSGTWVPQCLPQSEIRRQHEWRTFLGRYTDYTEFSAHGHDHNDPDYQPLNFKELVQMPFWKELYETCGYQLVSHIFEKCAMLYEAEDGLYLMVAYIGSAIYLRMMKFDNKIPQASGRVAQPRTSNSNAPRDKNPYQLSEQLKEKSFPKRNENHDIALGEVTTLKKFAATYPVVDVGKAGTTRNVIAKSASKKFVANAETPRWIKPTPELLKKIIDRRNELRRTGEIPCSSVSVDSSQLVLNFVLIKTDASFESDHKKLIVKRKAVIPTENLVLPPTWKGLKLPNNLKELTNGARSFQIHTYTITETLAKELGARIKPKGRSRKRKVSKESPVLMDERENDINSQSQLETQASQNSFASFVPSVLLPINNCLYNKSSWSKWPQHHCLQKAASTLPQDLVLACRFVVDSILDVPIASKHATEHLGEAISENWKSHTDRAYFLNCTIQKIIKVHREHKNLHKLFKSCLSHWRLKLQEKENRRLRKREAQTSAPLESQQKRLSQAKVSNVRENESRVDCILQPSLSMDVCRDPSNSSVIHLTQLSSTAHFSGSIQEVMEIENGNQDGDALVVDNACPALSTHTQSCLSTRKHDLTRKCSGLSAKSRSFRNLKHPAPYNCVMQSLKQIFHIMKINELLGSSRNVRGFFTFVRKAIILGGAKSSLHLGALMALIHPFDTPLAQVCGNDKCATETFTAKLVSWIFNQYVLVLLKTSFYITECNFTRFHLRFYLRECWTGATHKMKERLIQKGVLTLNSNAPNHQNAILRLVPKQNYSLRSLLIKKKSACRIPDHEIKTFKIFLHFVDSKITKSRMHIPTTIQTAWRNFVSFWKTGGSPKLYFLRMDIRDAYPSVSLPKLKEILMETTRGNCLVQKQFAIFCGSGRKIFRGSFFDKLHRQNWHSGIHVRPCIALDIEQDRAIQTANIVNVITALLTTSSVVKIGKRIYDFSYGLPQGWCLSPILCSIYYGYIDATLYMPYLQKRGCLFFRVVDDYLYITPDAAQVLNLMTLMKIGCENYGIKLNEEKSQTNVFVRSDLPVPSMKCESVTFCGWNICLSCGHVSRDFQKYEGQDFCSTITFQMPLNITEPEKFIRLRGTLIMPARLKPILLDPTINCAKRILLSTFEASIILGFRFYALCRVVYPSLNAMKEVERTCNLFGTIYICCLRLARFVARHCPQTSVDTQLVPFQNQTELTSCGENCCGMMHCASSDEHLQDQVILGQDSANKLLLSQDVLLYTALVGFRLKLANHSEAFKVGIFPKLDGVIAKLKLKLGNNQCSVVNFIIGSEMPACLQKIRI